MNLAKVTWKCRTGKWFITNASQGFSLREYVPLWHKLKLKSFGPGSLAKETATKCLEMSLEDQINEIREQ